MMTPADRAAARDRCSKVAAGPWRTYPNPMRTDGVFVGQDKPILPYKNAGRRLDGSQPCPAVPEDAWVLDQQVAPDVGEFIAHARTDLPAAIDDLDIRDQILKEILDGGEVGDFGALHCIITRATVSRIRVMIGQPDPDEDNG